MKLTLTSIVMAISALSVHAGSIGPNCGSCFGGTYTLDAYKVSAADGTETWRYTYTLYTQGVTGKDMGYVGSIAAKVTSSMISVTTVAKPTSGGWTTPLAGGLDNSGCNGSGAGWVCIAWKEGNQLLTGAAAPASYSWVFDVKMKAGTFLEFASVKANFDPANGKILSETISVPEGAAWELPMLLSGLGLWLFGVSRRRSRADA
jgi:hypothetical protein